MVPIAPMPGNASVLALFLALLPAVCAAAPRLELIVVGPSDEAYTLYGHAAMLVVEGAEPGPEDRLFNFGITDFERPNYVLDFLTGRVKFWGKQKTWGKASARWIREDRSVWRYPVNLPPERAQAVIDQMTHDVQPENREYVYDTFRENCATRLRDYLNRATDGAVQRTLDFRPTTLSYRDDVRHAYSERLALLIPTEIIPGVELDTPRTLWALSYRPELLGSALSRVEFDGPLLGEPIQINTRRGPDPRSGDPNVGQHWIAGVAAGVLLLALVALWLPVRAKGLLLGAWALGSGGLGAVLWGVHLSSDWPDMQYNWLAICCLPLDISLLWTAARQVWSRREAGAWVRGYLRLRLVTTAAVLGLTPALAAFRGPLPPRLLALAGVILALSCIGWARRD